MLVFFGRNLKQTSKCFFFIQYVKNFWFKNIFSTSLIVKQLDLGIEILFLNSFMRLPTSDFVLTFDIKQWCDELKLFIFIRISISLDETVMHSRKFYTSIFQI